jgi:hypothetical protein
LTETTGKKQWYYRSLAAGLPDMPMDTFIKMMAQAEEDHPELLPKNMTREEIEAAGLVEYRMKWFKHMSVFRNSPAMRYIDRALGDAGTAAAYRLLEVMAERYGEDGDFTGMLTLQGPTNEVWLANEILRESDPYEMGTVVKELEKYLNIFEMATFIEIGKINCKGTTLDHDGKRTEGVPVTIKTIGIRMELIADEYAMKKLKKKASEE